MLDGVPPGPWALGNGLHLPDDLGSCRFLSLQDPGGHQVPPSQAQSWQGDLAQFFAAIGRLSQDELKKVENSSYVTDKFLKLIKTPLPSYK